MSLFSTIAHPETPGLKGVSARGIGILALVLAAGMGLGYTVSNIDTTAGTTPDVQVGGLDHGEFLRINTEAMEWMVPMVPVIPRLQTAPAVDPFLEWNVGSYAALNQIWEVDTAFTKANTDLPVFGPHETAQAEQLQRFIDINVGAYNGLNQAWTVNPGFVEINTTGLEYQTGGYSDQPGGPR